MVGGCEVTLKMMRRTDDFDTVIDFMRKMWPEGVYLPSSEDQIYMLSEKKKLCRENDFFIYRDKETFDQVNDNGVTEDVISSIAHVILGSSDITYVIDDEDSHLHKKMKDLEQILLHKRS